MTRSLPIPAVACPAVLRLCRQCLSLPGIKERTVKTIKGLVQIPMTEGRRVMFVYPDEHFYAKVKVEILPDATYKSPMRH